MQIKAFYINDVLHKDAPIFTYDAKTNKFIYNEDIECPLDVVLEEADFLLFSVEVSEEEFPVIKPLSKKDFAEQLKLPPEEKLYSIWSEGFRTIGESSGAFLHGRAYGVSFKEACANYAKEDETFAESFNPDYMSYWGCRLFDNETDARVSFG